MSDATSNPSDSPNPSPDPRNRDNLRGDDESDGQAFIDSFLYGLSVPERTARSLSAVAAGLTTSVAARLIPSAFRSSTSYRVFVQDSLDLLAHDIGGIARPVDRSSPDKASGAIDGAKPDEATIAQKAVGGLLDYAGGATLHLSPMTVLAVISDVAYGSNTYLKRLADELREQNIIDDDSAIHGVNDLIDAVARASNRSVNAVETPPLDLKGLQQTVDDVRAQLGRAELTDILPQSELVHLWEEMESVAEASKFGMWQVASTMAMHATGRVDRIVRGGVTTMRVTGNLLDEHILDHYADSLTSIANQGVYATLRDETAPAIEAIWNNYNRDQSTWTEDLLGGKWLAAARNAVSDWWSGDESSGGESSGGESSGGESSGGTSA